MGRRGCEGGSSGVRFGEAERGLLFGPVDLCGRRVFESTGVYRSTGLSH